MIKTSRSGGFTLIELLVVISIIALLAGLAFPALQGAMDAAQKAQASTMCNQLSIACTMYNTEYGVWPTYSGNGTFGTSPQVGALCYSLNGCRNLDGSGSVDVTFSTVPNARGIQFMSFNKKDIKTGNEIQSPYKKARNRQYWVTTDDNYDNTINVPDPASNSNKNFVLGVGVWAAGDSANTPSISKMLTSYK